MQDIKIRKHLITPLTMLTIGMLCTCYTQAQIASDYLAFNNKRIGGNHYSKALLPDDSTRQSTIKTSYAVSSDTSGNNYWSLNGNTGTNPAVNFIGTTEDVPLIFKANGTPAGSTGSPSYYNVSFGWATGNNGYANTAIGAQAMQYMGGNGNTAVGTWAAWLNTSGEQNVAIGSSALAYNNAGSFNTAIGQATLKNSKVGPNTAIGGNSMVANTTGLYNTAVGVQTLWQNQEGYYNTAIGHASQHNTMNASNNTSVGALSLNVDSSGSYNTAMGVDALYTNTVGDHNTAMGFSAGWNNINGSYITLLGAGADVASSVRASGLTNATAIGAGATVVQSNTLVLGNNASVGIGTNSPLALLHVNGTVLIGTPADTNVYTPSSYMLDVKGTMRANKVAVNTTGADFVFEKDYKLKPLRELEAYIKSNHHLPEIQSATTMQQEGMDVGELQTKLLAKVEELSLYIIEQNKKIEKLEEQNKKIEELEQKVQQLQSPAKKN